MAKVLLEEQRKIANFLGAIDAKIHQLDAQITQTETFKKDCFSRCLSNAVRVRSRKLLKRLPSVQYSLSDFPL